MGSKRNFPHFGANARNEVNPAKYLGLIKRAKSEPSDGKRANLFSAKAPNVRHRPEQKHNTHKGGSRALVRSSNEYIYIMARLHCALLVAIAAVPVLAALYEYEDGASAFDWLHAILLGMGLSVATAASILTV